MKAKLKNLSAPVAVALGFLDRYDRGGAYISDVAEDYRLAGIEISERSLCVYLNRVKHLGFLVVTQEQHPSVRYSVYKITPAGRKHLRWWRSILKETA